MQREYNRNPARSPAGTGQGGLAARQGLAGSGGGSELGALGRGADRQAEGAPAR